MLLYSSAAFHVSLQAIKQILTVADEGRCQTEANLAFVLVALSSAFHDACVTSAITRCTRHNVNAT